MALAIGGLQMNRDTEIGTELATLGRGRELGWGRCRTPCPSRWGTHRLLDTLIAPDSSILHLLSCVMVSSVLFHVQQSPGWRINAMLSYLKLINNLKKYQYKHMAWRNHQRVQWKLFNISLGVGGGKIHLSKLIQSYSLNVCILWYAILCQWSW